MKKVINPTDVKSSYSNVKLQNQLDTIDILDQIINFINKSKKFSFNKRATSISIILLINELFSFFNIRCHDRRTRSTKIIEYEY